MPEKDHQFKRTIVKNEFDCAEQAEADTHAENEDKVRRFQWDDIDDEKSEGKVFEASDEEIMECVLLLSSYLLSNMGTEHFAGTDTSGMSLVIPVDLDLHSLLHKRFEEEWNLDARIDMFQCLQENFSAEFNAEMGGSENRTKLDEKIQEVLPPTRRKKFVLGEVSLVDDAMAIGEESNMVSIEIPLNLAANL